jgi:7-carboxy-7-deazaguanine synthase
VNVLRIAEIFRSIQGEGLYAGTPSLFVRTTGCNLRCWFCDTPYTSWSPEGRFCTLDDLLQQYDSADTRHVVLTGGEPLLQPAIVTLSQQLRDRGAVITIETAATVDRPVVADLMSISPKLSNSIPQSHPHWRQRHEATQFRPDVVRRWLRDYRCQWKFVVDGPSDLHEVDRYLQQFPAIRPDTVWLMPQATTTEALHAKREWLEPAALQAGYRYCGREQIVWFGHVRGT